MSFRGVLPLFILLLLSSIVAADFGDEYYENLGSSIVLASDLGISERPVLVHDDPFIDSAMPKDRGSSWEIKTSHPVSYISSIDKRRIDASEIRQGVKQIAKSIDSFRVGASSDQWELSEVPTYSGETCEFSVSVKNASGLVQGDPWIDGLKFGFNTTAQYRQNFTYQYQFDAGCSPSIQGNDILFSPSTQKEGFNTISTAKVIDHSDLASYEFSGKEYSSAIDIYASPTTQGIIYVDFESGPFIDPTITNDSNSRYDSGDVNVTQGNGLAHLTVNNEGVFENLTYYFPFETSVPQEWYNQTEIGGLGVRETGSIVDGIVGRAANRTNVTVKPGVSLNSSVPYAFFAWIKPEENMSVVGNRGVIFDLGALFNLVQENDDENSYNFRVSGGNNIDSLFDAQIGEWQFIGYTSHGNGTFSFYLNNESNTPNEVTSFPTSDRIRFGYGASAFLPFHGIMDEGMLLRRYVNATDALAIYERTAPLFEDKGSHTFNRINTTNSSVNQLNVSFDNLTQLNGTSFEASVSTWDEADGYTNRWNDSSLVAWYTFDDDDNVTAQDWSGNNNDGVYVGNDTVNRQSGYYVRGLNSTEGGIVNISDSPELSGMQELTVSAWVRKEGFATILGKWNGDESYLLQIRGDNTFRGYIENSSGTQARPQAADIALADGVWHHLVLTYNGSVATSYSNGVLADTAPLTGAVRTTTTELKLGGINPAAGLVGDLDDVMIFNRSLSANEVGELYAYGSTNYDETARKSVSSNVEESFDFTAGAEFAWINLYYQSGLNQMASPYLQDNVTYQFGQSGAAPNASGILFSNFIEVPTDPATYHPSNNYEFKVDINATNNTLAQVQLHFDGQEYNATNVSDTWSVSGIENLSVDNYTYFWAANSTTGKYNESANQSYVVEQADPTLTLSITPSSSVEEGTNTSAFGNGCPSQISCQLFRNGSSVSNPDVATLSAGIYEYEFNTSGNENYTSSSLKKNLTVGVEPSSNLTILEVGLDFVRYAYEGSDETLIQISTNNEDYANVNSSVFGGSIDRNNSQGIVTELQPGTRYYLRSGDPTPFTTKEFTTKQHLNSALFFLTILLSVAIISLLASFLVENTFMLQMLSGFFFLIVAVYWFNINIITGLPKMGVIMIFFIISVGVFYSALAKQNNEISLELE